tara:strand:- start:3715 stop:3912 length:198 start_codon:yes stop_codon:yes gene_type:complete
MSDKPNIVFDVTIYARSHDDKGMVTDFYSIDGQMLDDETIEVLRKAVYTEVNRQLDAKIKRLRSV